MSLLKRIESARPGSGPVTGGSGSPLTQPPSGGGPVGAPPSASGGDRRMLSQAPVRETGVVAQLGPPNDPGE